MEQAAPSFPLTQHRGAWSVHGCRVLNVSVCLPKFTCLWSHHDVFIGLDGQGLEQERVTLHPSGGCMDRATSVPAWLSPTCRLKPHPPPPPRITALTSDFSVKCVPAGLGPLNAQLGQLNQLQKNIIWSVNISVKESRGFKLVCGFGAGNG